MSCKNRAFTLSEVLITLVVIGVIAAITVPVVMKSFIWQQYRDGALKAISNMEQLARLYQAKESSGAFCGYWEQNPWSKAGNGAKCTTRDDDGYCKKWKLKDGSDLPKDYNGFFSECESMYQFFVKNMKTVKVCDKNAYANSCIPKYNGMNTLYKDKNEDISDYDVNVKTGSSGFNQSQILAGSAFITADGTIYFTYIKGSLRLIAFDVNGFKGPNKWGYDVFAVQPTKKSKYAPPKFSKQYAASSLTEKGGKTLYDLTVKPL